VNPVLADGEIGFIKDTNELVIGNGVDTFSNLSRISVVEAVGYQSGYNKIQIDGIDALTGSEIVEEGTNANGEYIKYENGLIISYGSISKTVSTNNILRLTYPVQIYDAVTSLSINILGSTLYLSSYTILQNYYSKDSSGVNFAYMRADGQGLQGVAIQYSFITIGRWK
jgi:hypothetical protein